MSEKKQLYAHDEMFDILDEKSWSKTGQEKRGVVHRDGILHQSVSVWITNGKGDLLLQRRHSNKSICPECWDVSCAEHLKPNESFAAAAVRGMGEELGIVASDGGPAPVTLELVRDRHQKTFKYPSQGIVDNELNMVYLCSWEGPLKIDKVEVSEVAWVSPQELSEELLKPEQQRKREYTPWCLQDGKALVEFWAKQKTSS